MKGYGRDYQKMQYMHCYYISICWVVNTLENTGAGHVGEKFLVGIWQGSID